MNSIFQDLVLIADIAPQAYWRSNEIPSDWNIVAAGFAIAAAVVTAGLMVARLKRSSTVSGQSRLTFRMLTTMSALVVGLIVVTLGTLGTVWRAHWERDRWVRKGASDAYKHQLLRDAPRA